MIINDPNKKKIDYILREFEKQPALNILAPNTNWYGSPVHNWKDMLDFEKLRKLFPNLERERYEKSLDASVSDLNTMNLNRAVSQGGGFDMPVLSALINMLTKGAGSIKNRINPPERKSDIDLEMLKKRGY